MNRRRFLIESSVLGIGVPLLSSPLKSMETFKDLVIGHNGFQYKVDLNWGALNSNFYPVNDCHEMCIDKNRRVILLTNNIKNNIIIYDQKGNVLETWGKDYPGAHGLTLKNEGGTEYMYICDNNRHEVIKTNLKGEVILTLPYPKESEKYTSPEEYVPTETAISENGDIYVADGYGAQYIMHYDEKGRLKNVFGGRGDRPENFDNAHGICIDTRSGKEELLITARNQNKLKRFTLGGKLIEEISLPGAYICRPVIHGENVYLATIWSGDKENESGFVSILDKENKLISAPGGCTPIYKNGELQKMYQTYKVFQHPHDVCIDQDDNIYVAQWNSGKTYPIKMKRV